MNKKLTVILDPHNSARYGTNIVGASSVSIEPKADGTERPQMAWLRPHLNGASAPTK